MHKAPTVNQSLKFSSLKDEMPLKGPAISRPQPPPRGKSRMVSRSPRRRR
jgi:hypothetical protein